MLIPIPWPQSLIPIPAQFDFLDSGSDSSRNVTDSGIDSDSGIGIVHHWLIVSKYPEFLAYLCLCMVGSYASVSVRSSVCDFTQIQHSLTY